MTSGAYRSEESQNVEGLRAALADETRGLSIRPTPVAAMMHDGAVRRRQRRVGFASGAATLGVAAAVAVAAFGTGPAANTSPGTGAAPPQKPTTANQNATPGAATTPGSSTAKDQIIVLGSGTFQGRGWRLVRDRFVITETADEGPPKNLLTGVDHLPFNDYGKPGTVACEALGIQFGDAAPGYRPDYDVGYSCKLSWNPDEAAPQQFLPSSFNNGMDKATGKPTFITAFGYGPAAGFNGSTAVSAALTVNGVTGQRQPLMVAPSENTAYYAFLAPATTINRPNATITLYDAQGNKVGTFGAEYASSSSK